jgi:hypothetical protein
MAEPFDLTGQNIETTYQRILQTDGTFVYDGTGSLVNINISGSPVINTGSFATTGSNIFLGDQIITGSISVTGAVSASYFIGIIDGGTF